MGNKHKLTFKFFRKQLYDQKYILSRKHVEKNYYKCSIEIDLEQQSCRVVLITIRELDNLFFLILTKLKIERKI
jgi:regulation of enolase protein 1 (concanavalin A-like superfamily)